MAAYLSLVSKTDGSMYAGRDLIKVDEMLCAHLGIEPDPVDWHMGWMDWIGFSLAYRADKPVAEVLAKMLDNARRDERDIIEWFIDTFENASYHGF